MTASKEKAPAQGGLGAAQKPRCEFSTEASPPVKPVFPDSRFLPGRVLMRLLAGRRLTHLDSWRELGHARLADSIWKLRKLGWPVHMDEKNTPTSDGTRRAMVGVYYLPHEAIEAAGIEGRQYAAAELLDSNKDSRHES